MNIWRRDNRLAQRHSIRKRPRRRLRGTGVGRNINVGSFDQVEQLFGFDKRVDPANMLINAERRCQRMQPFAISFAFAGDEIGVGRANDAVKKVRMVRRNGGQRGNDRLDPFARR